MTLAAAAVCGLTACVPPVKAAKAADAPANTLYLGGQFLVAAPKMPDPRFAKTVILITEHDTAGAFGFVINKVIGRGPLSTFMKGFGITAMIAPEETVSLHLGGPVQIDTAAVLHSPDYKDSSTKKAGKNMMWSNHKDVLSAIAAGKGPKKRLFFVGYSGWAAGQLEQELAREDWLTAPADASLIFGQDPDTLWDRIMATAGVKL